MLEAPMGLKVSVLAESIFARQANGIHTALLQLTELLQRRREVRLTPTRVNGTVDIVHAHTVGLRYLLISMKHGDRLVVSAHIVPSTCGGVIVERLCRTISRVYLRMAYNRAKLVLAVSPAVRNELLAIGVRSEIAVLYNRVDRKKFRRDPTLGREFRRKLQLAPDDFVVLCVGQIQPRKGIQTFVAVAKRLRSMKFVWVGGRPFGRWTAKYRAISRLLASPPDNVLFAGPATFEEMPGYYAMADVFFFPSHHECFSFAILEASSAGLPLVLRDIPEYESHLIGHYLPARNKDQFVETLKRLRDDEDFLSQWQQAAALFAAEFEVSGYLDDLLAHYQAVASNI